MIFDYTHPMELFSVWWHDNNWFFLHTPPKVYKSQEISVLLASCFQLSLVVPNVSHIVLSNKSENNSPLLKDSLLFIMLSIITKKQDKQYQT